jgi:predicted metallopeptidase
MNVHPAAQSSGAGTSGGKLSFQERIKVMTNYIKASRAAARAFGTNVYLNFLLDLSPI